MCGLVLALSLSLRVLAGTSAAPTRACFEYRPNLSNWSNMNNEQLASLEDHAQTLTVTTVGLV